MKGNEISQTALEFLQIASEFVGKYEEEAFSINTFNEFSDLEMQSPIEHVLYSAMLVVSKLNGYWQAEPIDSTNMSTGISILPQSKIGKYKVDFLVSFYLHKGNKKYRQVIVECDGTAFHERTETERRREKFRDRFMQKIDFKVFRYTGKEILQDPFNIAVEIIDYVTGGDGTGTVTPKEYFS